MICADERRTPICGPKSTRSFQAGRRASGKSSTSTMRPTRMSTRAKSSNVDLLGERLAHGRSVPSRNER